MGGPILVVAGFALGAVPFGYLIGRAAGIDVRRIGSGNIGAANLLRSVGRSAALLTLLLDTAKGALPVALARGAGLAPEWQAAVAGAAVLGHIYTPFLKFRGGKGVATTLGALAVATWPVAAASTAVWLATVALFRFTSLAALVAAALLPGLAWWLDGRRAFVALAAALALLLVWRHRQNIERLRRGTEPRIGQRVAAASRSPSA
ncbi:MAG TPA: glycerol-3-phosphate 1-O-acyltransferase PlsY [Candidatus Methylomirabilis sp.]